MFENYVAMYWATFFEQRKVYAYIFNWIEYIPNQKDIVGSNIDSKTELYEGRYQSARFDP